MSKTISLNKGRELSLKKTPTGTTAKTKKTDSILKSNLRIKIKNTKEIKPEIKQNE